MTKKALLIIDEKDMEDELPSLQKKLKSLERDLDIKLLVRSDGISLDREAENFFSSSLLSPEEEKGWSLVKEKEKHFFFVLYVDMEFEADHSLEQLWTERIENYIQSPELSEETVWKLFCGNELSRKRIYITPVRTNNIDVLKSIFRIFLNKQMDSIRAKEKRDVELRYYLTAEELPYRSGDSSERLITACSNIYKLAESLKKERLYLSTEVQGLLPPNIKNSLKDVEEEGNLFSYTFNLLT